VAVLIVLSCSLSGCASDPHTTDTINTLIGKVLDHVPDPAPRRRPNTDPLVADPPEVAAGMVEIGWSTGRDLVLKNNSATTVKVVSIKTSHPAFRLDVVAVPIVLEPGAHLDLHITFRPSVSVFYNEKLIIQTDNPKKEQKIQLRGS